MYDYTSMHVYVYEWENNGFLVGSRTSYYESELGLENHLPYYWSCM